MRSRSAWGYLDDVHDEGHGVQAFHGDAAQLVGLGVVGVERLHDPDLVGVHGGPSLRRCMDALRGYARLCSSLAAMRR